MYKEGTTRISSALSIDGVSSHTNEVVSVHLTGNLVVLTQRGIDQVMLGAVFEWLILSRKLETLRKELYPRYSHQLQLYSGD
jgi:hypothetical protein